MTVYAIIAFVHTYMYTCISTMQKGFSQQAKARCRPKGLLLITVTLMSAYHNLHSK